MKKIKDTWNRMPSWAKATDIAIVLAIIALFNPLLAILLMGVLILGYCFL